MAKDPQHDRLLKIALALPEAYEDRPWGSVHCKVASKIFVGWGRESGEMSLGFKTTKPLQELLVSTDDRFTVAKYVGQHGWVDMRLGPKPDWAEVEQFVADSYRMIAPKKLVRALEEREGAKPAAAAKPVKAKKNAGAKPVSRKRR